MVINLILKQIWGFLFLLCDNKYVQFLSTRSSFLRNMITHNVDFFWKWGSLHASNYSPFESYTIANYENDNNESIRLSFLKNWADDRCTMYLNIGHIFFKLTDLKLHSEHILLRIQDWIILQSINQLQMTIYFMRTALRPFASCV